MRNFERAAALAVLSVWANPYGFADAAVATLRDQSQLSGEVTAILGDGSIALKVPFSEAPLLLQPSSLAKLDFEGQGSNQGLPDQRLELKNGDVLPVKVQSMENGIFRLESPVLGALSVPRDAARTLQMGVVPQNEVYAGGGDFDGWERREQGARVWEAEDGEFVCAGQGALYRDLKLPDKYILTFRYRWEKYANFQLRFAEPSDVGEHYAMDFSGNGVSIHREFPDRRRTPLVQQSQILGSSRERSIEVEIRMDRVRGLLELRVDGVLLGRYTDPVKPVPAGTGITLMGRAASESRQWVGEIRVHEWDDRRDRHRSEERGDPKRDSLIGRYGERLGGTLETVKSVAGSAVYLFKSDFQPDPIELPEEEISVLFLSGDKDKSAAKEGDMILGLRGEGSLRVVSCTLEDGKVRAVHALLGELVFPQSSLSFIEKIWVQPAKPSFPIQEP